jgi:hypothetical protein
VQLYDMSTMDYFQFYYYYYFHDTEYVEYYFINIWERLTDCKLDFLKNFKLLELHLVNINICSESIKRIAKALESVNCKLEVLELKNYDQDSDFNFIYRALQSNNCKLIIVY